MIDRQGAKAPRFLEPSEFVDGLARRVIGAAIEVHRHLGPGFSESVYEEALAFEFEIRQIPFSRQHPMRVSYKGRPVGEGRADFIVDGALVVEIKASRILADAHSAQVISYLKAGGYPLGLLLNFREAVMRRGVKRVVWARPALKPQGKAGHVQECHVAYGGLVVPRCNSPKSFQAVKEDLHAISQPV